MFALTACTSTENVPVTSIRTEYKDRVHTVTDSVLLHDSVFVHMSGDTLYRDRWHTDRVVSVRRDTIYTLKDDTIQVPYLKSVYVEKKLNWYQKALMGTGVFALLLLVVLIIYKIKIK